MYNYGLSLLAGILSTLSPCVLPILPIIVASAFNAHKYAPLALSLGLILSYSLLGVFLSSLLGSFSVPSDLIREISAIIFIVLGFILVSAKLQQFFSRLSSGLSGLGDNVLTRFKLNNLVGQFFVGLILGLIWTPCVGPTLGAALVLANQGEQLGYVISIMAAFGLGATLPILAIAYISRNLKTPLAKFGVAGKYIFGVLLIIVGLTVLLHLDKAIETFLVQILPSSWINLTTQF